MLMCVRKREAVMESDGGIVGGVGGGGGGGGLGVYV